MLERWKEKIAGIWIVLAPIVVVAITWHVFWEIIHPVLVGINPMFVYNPDGRVGRYPDSPVQVALFITVLFMLFIYFMLYILIFKGIDEFTDMLIGLYGIVVIVPLAIIKNDVLPLVGIDRWKHDPYEDDS